MSDGNRTKRAVIGASRKIAFLAAVAASLLVFAPSSSASVRVLAADPLESAVVARVNSVRASHGLRPLANASLLKTAATRHVTDMARHGYFSHSWSTGAPFGRWIRAYWPGPGYRSWSAGENLYWRALDTNAVEVVNAWMASPPHRANLLSRGWRRLGVGAVVAGSPLGVYLGSPAVTIVAVEFGRRS